MAAKKQMKGDVGKSTGKTTRDAIAAKRKQGYTLGQIASAPGVRRDETTIQAIASGTIKNPPAGLAEQIRKAKIKGKPKRKGNPDSTSPRRKRKKGH